jgi:hypothetical protein
MSKSVHQTFHGVFGGKSKTEIQRMIDEQDPGFLALLHKLRIKRQVREVRELEAFLGEAPGEGNERSGA